MAHRYRLYPNDVQEAACRRHCADARFVWNLALEQFNLYDRRAAGCKPPGPAERYRQLAEARRHTWLRSGSSSIQQQALRDLDRAVGNWWKGTHRRPTWRKAGRHESFCVRDVSFAKLSRRWATIHIPKCGYVRFRLTRPLPLTYGMARIALDRAGRWHVSFSAPQAALKRTPNDVGIGIDLGIAATVTLSDGAAYKAPELRPTKRRCLLKLEHKLARQVKGSRRRDLTRRKIARMRAREADHLKDWREKVTTRLVVDNDLIAIEDLRVGSMMRSAKGTIDRPGINVRQKAGLNREIARQGWSAFAQRLAQKAGASGVELIRIDPTNTSRRCNACGHTAAENRKSQAVFACEACGHEDHADVNAAKNILAAGLAVTGRGGSVRPPVAKAARGRPGEASTTYAAIAA